MGKELDHYLNVDDDEESPLGLAILCDILNVPYDFFDDFDDDGWVDKPLSERKP